MNDSPEKNIKTVAILGENSKEIKDSLDDILKPHLLENEEALIVESRLENIKEMISLFQKSSFPVLVLDKTDEFPFEKIKPIVEAMAGKGFLLVNSDGLITGQPEESVTVPILSFGFEGSSDFHASDMKINGGINFKMNYLGKSVPIWLEKEKWEERMSGALAVIAVATIFGLNLVKISEALKGPDKA